LRHFGRARRQWLTAERRRSSDRSTVNAFSSGLGARRDTDAPWRNDDWPCMPPASTLRKNRICTVPEDQCTSESLRDATGNRHRSTGRRPDGRQTAMMRSVEERRYRSELVEEPALISRIRTRPPASVVERFPDRRAVPISLARNCVGIEHRVRSHRRPPGPGVHRSHIQLDPCSDRPWVHFFRWPMSAIVIRASTAVGFGQPGEHSSGA